MSADPKDEGICSCSTAAFDHNGKKVKTLSSWRKDGALPVQDKKQTDVDQEGKINENK